ncbi:hypothetical protein IFT74_15485 [Oxalobacteraceae sp. CFBP 8755]|nr:hypothetical protein [Oxalobacteraceae sp. CFBP 8755]
MARARNIKPGFFTNDELVELPFSTRLLFIGLWTIADREGRMVDRPKKIKMEIFPADDVDCDQALAQLADSGFITRYQADGVKVVEIVNFAKHQAPHSTEKDSLLPDAEGFYTVNERNKNSGVTGKFTRSKAGDAKPNVNPPLDNVVPPSDNALIPDSPILNPDSLITADASAPTADDGDDVPAEPDNPRAAPMPPRVEPPESIDPAIVLSTALRKLGVDATFTQPAVQAWASQKTDMAVLIAAVGLAREHKGETVKIHPNYLVPIVDKLLNPQAASTTSYAKPTAAPIQARKPMGMDPKGTDESYEEFDARIAAAEATRRKALNP